MQMHTQLNNLRHKVVWFNLINLFYSIYHLNANETNEEKARWELCKNAMCYFEQVLKATPHKVRQTRHAGHCWRIKDEFLSDIHL